LTLSQCGRQFIITPSETGIFLHLPFYPFDNAADGTVFFDPKLSADLLQGIPA